LTKFYTVFFCPFLAYPEEGQEEHWMYGFTGHYFVSDDIMDSDKMLKGESNTDGEKKE